MGNNCFLHQPYVRIFYLMNNLCLQKHIDTKADITVSCVPMDDRYKIDLSSRLDNLFSVNPNPICVL